jgi:hypothetical protein
MAGIHVAADMVIPAPAARVYELIADNSRASLPRAA